MRNLATRIFYTLGEKLDIDQISKWSRALGLGEITGIDLPFEVQGIVPSRAWKRDISGERWYPGENYFRSYWTGTGVGDADFVGSDDVNVSEWWRQSHAAVA